jgi:hypothetical protein
MASSAAAVRGFGDHHVQKLVNRMTGAAIDFITKCVRYDRSLGSSEKVKKDRMLALLEVFLRASGGWSEHDLNNCFGAFGVRHRNLPHIAKILSEELANYFGECIFTKTKHSGFYSKIYVSVPKIMFVSEPVSIPPVDGGILE